MTIKAYFGEKASRTHENHMLQEFLEHLEPRWGQSEDWIYIIANAVWDGAEIDFVCLLPSMVLVGDFKDYSGKLTGAENGAWLIDNVIEVRGGSKANPFSQLKTNKFRVINWLNNHRLLQEQNLGHIAGVLLFSDLSEDNTDLSDSVKRWLHIADMDGAASALDALASPNLIVRERDAETIVKILGVTPLSWESRSPLVESLVDDANDWLDESVLTEHQQSTLDAIERFIRDPGQASMSIFGMTSTGKSRILQSAIKIAERDQLKAIALAPNSRLAKLYSTSIYQHLYLGESNKGNDEKQVPLRSCIDPDDCVYMIDDAYLLSDEVFKTVDGVQFGSGRLLSDFFQFVNIGKQNTRKLIFFGDPYQLQRNERPSVLDGSFQTARGIAHVSIGLDQVLPRKGALFGNLVRLVNAIRSGDFSSLDFEQDEGFALVGRETAAPEMKQLFERDLFRPVYLAYKHADVAKFESWLRKHLFGGSAALLEAGDLIELVSSPYQGPSDDPFGEMRFSGRGRCVVTRSGDIRAESQSLKGRSEPIQFRLMNDVEVSGGSVHDSNQRLDRLLVDFLVAERPELPPDVGIAVNVWTRNIDRGAGANGAASRDGEDPEDEQTPSGFSGVTLARYGYGSTVHGAQGRSFPIVYLNAKHDAGQHTDAYFRWLYTALAVAGERVRVVNFTAIHPFDTMVMVLDGGELVSDIPVGGGWSVNSATDITAADERRSRPPGLEQSSNNEVSAALWLSVDKAAQGLGWTVSEVRSSSYLERYELSDGKESMNLRVSYNAKHQVKTMRSDDQHWPVLCELAEACLLTAVYGERVQSLMAQLRRRVSGSGWRLVSAVETDWLLRVSLVRSVSEGVELDMHFNKDGCVTKVRPRKFTRRELVVELGDTLT